MSKVKSSEEAAIPAMKEAQAKGSPEKSAPGVKDTLPQGMKAPKDPGEHGMGGIHKGNDAHIGNSGMSAARKHLEMDTERGSHIPDVGGHKMHGHSGKMG